MFEPNSVYAKIAYDAILLHIKAKTKLEKKESEIPQALKLRLGCYVRVLDPEGNVKSSYGNPEPKQNYLFHEIIDNAIAAAESLSEEDLSNITVNVDVFSEPKEIQNIDLLKPHKNGIIIQNQNKKKAILYPNPEDFSNPNQMVQLAKEKVSAAEEDNSNFEMKYFSATRYK
ncbi:MAG: AMMECR1 domain-containing protein [Bacteroidales bacterium]